MADVKKKQFEALITVKPRFATCAEKPAALLGRLDVKLADNLTEFTELSPELENIENGGFWAPKNCIPRAKVAVLVPLRNRPRQLEIFLRHTIPVLKRQLLLFRIFVIEQVGYSFFYKEGYVFRY